jgi:hypothetical protein
MRISFVDQSRKYPDATGGFGCLFRSGQFEVYLSSGDCTNELF